MPLYSIFFSLQRGPTFLSLRWRGRQTRYRPAVAKTVGTHCRWCLICTCVIVAAVFHGGAFQAEAQQSSAIFKKPDWLSDCAGSGSLKRDQDLEVHILNEYGAAFLSTAFSSDGAVRPIRCRFLDGNGAKVFDEQLRSSPKSRVPENFYLQPAANQALLKLISDMGGMKFLARNCNEYVVETREGRQVKAFNPDKCTEGINNDWALRTFEQTVCNWFQDCSAKGPHSRSIANRQTLTEAEWDQVDRNLLPKMLSFAIPGGSQHMFGIAIDVNNGASNSDFIGCSAISNNPAKRCRICDEDNCVRKLNDSFWYRTVTYDPYHFTFLGRPASDLPALGLKQVACKQKRGAGTGNTFTYWVPNVEGYEKPKGYECIAIKP